MDSAVWITGVVGIAGIVVSGLLGPWLSARWNREMKRLEFEQDRALTDLEELRKLLDDIAKGAADVYSRFGTAASWLQTIVPDDAEMFRGTMNDAVQSAANGIVAMTDEVPRITLRLGATHPVLQAYVALHSAMTQWMAGRYEKAFPLSDERKRELTEVYELIGQRYATFFHQGYLLVKSDLTPY